MKRLSFIGFITAGCMATVLWPYATFGATSADFVNAVCAKVRLCAETSPKLRKQFPLKGNACVNQLQGKGGQNFWHRMGLKTQEPLTAADVETMVNNGKVLLSQNNFSQCVSEISALSCGTLEESVTKDFARIETIISDKGACPKVYAEVVPATATTGQLIESICASYANCQKGSADPITARAQCVTELNGPAGKGIWDQFGLKKLKNQFSAEDIEQRIASRDMAVDVENLNNCKAKLSAIACSSFEKNVTQSNWANLAKILSNRYPCEHVLMTTRSKF